jgi:hypothetical protein
VKEGGDVTGGFGMKGGDVTGGFGMTGGDVKEGDDVTVSVSSGGRLTNL